MACILSQTYCDVFILQLQSLTKRWEKKLEQRKHRRLLSEQQGVPIPASSDDVEEEQPTSAPLRADNMVDDIVMQAWASATGKSKKQVRTCDTQFQVQSPLNRLMFVLVVLLDSAVCAIRVRGGGVVVMVW